MRAGGFPLMLSGLLGHAAKMACCPPVIDQGHAIVGYAVIIGSKVARAATSAEQPDDKRRSVAALCELLVTGAAGNSVASGARGATYSAKP